MAMTKNAQFIMGFDCIKTDGTADTTTAPTVTISKDGGNFASTTNSAARIQSTNVFSLTLTATEMNADMVVVQATGAGLVPRTMIFYPGYIYL